LIREKHRQAEKQAGTKEAGRKTDRGHKLLERDRQAKTWHHAMIKDNEKDRSETTESDRLLQTDSLTERYMVTEDGVLVESINVILVSHTDG